MYKLKTKLRLTESSLCLLGTSSQKSLKLTLGSVAGPVRHDNRGETSSEKKIILKWFIAPLQSR